MRDLGSTMTNSGTDLCAGTISPLALILSQLSIHLALIHPSLLTPILTLHPSQLLEELPISEECDEIPLVEHIDLVLSSISPHDKWTVSGTLGEVGKCSQVANSFTRDIWFPV